MAENTDDLFVFDDELVKSFDEAEVQTREFKDVPDGEYVVVLEKAELKKKANGDKQLSGWLKVFNGDHEDRLIFKNWTLNKVGMPFFKTDMATMGVKMHSLKDLQEAFVELNPVDPSERKLLRITKKAQKTNPKYSNVYINSLTSLEEVEEDTQLSAGVRHEDAAF